MSVSSSPGDRDAKYGLLSADRSGISSKGKDHVADDNILASASSEAFATAPVKSSEQEEFAKEWAHKPRRVVLFVEPSPFSYVLPLVFHVECLFSAFCLVTGDRGCLKEDTLRKSRTSQSLLKCPRSIDLNSALDV
jgi:hypothetical protein